MEIQFKESGTCLNKFPPACILAGHLCFLLRSWCTCKLSEMFDFCLICDQDAVLQGQGTIFQQILQQASRQTIVDWAGTANVIACPDQPPEIKVFNPLHSPEDPQDLSKCADVSNWFTRHTSLPSTHHDNSRVVAGRESSATIQQCSYFA